MNEKLFNLNQGEEGLDDLFRNAADAEQPAAPAHAWLKMNLLLDEEEQKRRRGFAWWWLPLLLFMAGHRHFVPAPGRLEDVNIKTSISQREAYKFQNEKNISSRQILKHDLSANESVAEQKDAAPSALATAQKSAELKRDASSDQLKKPKIYSTTSRAFFQSTASFNKRSNKESTGLETPFEIALTSDNTLYPSMPQKQQLSLPVSVSIIDTVIPGQTIVSTRKQQPAAYRFYVYAGGGADLGFVNTRNSADVKPAYGAGLGFQLNKRWAMQVGFTQTRKIYEAPGDAYTPKAGSYYDNPNFVIQEVYADCAILEIPISVRYNFLPNQQHQVFGMLSMQNAIMQRESYDYYYTRFGQPAKGYYTYRTKALELFSGIGFSMGYEYRISDRLHVQAAPYFNIPTKGIGEGSVKLRSAGLFAGLRYSFWKKK